MNAWDNAIIALLLFTILGLLVDLLVRFLGIILKEYNAVAGLKKVVIWKRKKLKRRS